MRHGRFPNGLRKVEVIDNLGRVDYWHLSGEGTLRDAIGDPWQAAATDASGLAITHWSKVSSLAAQCGDEVEVFNRAPDDWMRAQTSGVQ